MTEKILETYTILIQIDKVERDGKTILRSSVSDEALDYATYDPGVRARVLMSAAHHLTVIANRAYEKPVEEEAKEPAE